MVNILIPAMGKSLFFTESYFPKPMIEIGGDTILEKMIRNFEEVEGRFIFVFDQKDCSEFHLDASAKILSPDAKVLVLEHPTGGALCTCLMAIEEVGGEEPLIIANCDQIIDVDYRQVLSYFDEQQADAGVITFESVHPRWSYVKVRDEEVVEVAEKRPLSKEAIAGFYYFRHGSDFIKAAETVVLKENHLDGRYYISSSLNEIILMGKKVARYTIPRKHYHSFYSPEKIKEYEGLLRSAAE